MPAEVKSDLELEIAHVLFIDVAVTLRTFVLPNVK